MALAVPVPMASAPPQRIALPQQIAARLTGSGWFWALFLATGFAFPIVRSVLRELPAAPPVLGTLPPYELVDQAGRPFRSADLRGIVILEFASADALRAEGSPLAMLQKRVRNTGNAVHLVTFVRGRADLAALAKSSGAGAWRWTLAGGDVAPLEEMVKRTLRLDPLDGRLILADGQGRIRRVTSALPEEIDLMMRDIGLLANLGGESR